MSAGAAQGGEASFAKRLVAFAALVRVRCSGTGSGVRHPDLDAIDGYDAAPVQHGFLSDALKNCWASRVLH